MPTEAAPATPPAAEAVAAPPADLMEAAVAKYEARQDAAAADPKAAGAGVTSNTASTTPGTGAPAKPRASDISALAQREWAARQKEQQAAAALAKYQGLDQALSKKDLKATLTVLAEQHGVTFADFVNVLTETGETPPAKTAAETAEEVVARKLKERDDAAAEAQRKALESQYQQREAQLRATCQEKAEKGTPEDPNRWELVAIAGSGPQAWDIITGHYNATTVIENGVVVKEGEKLSIEHVLDLMEAKQREKQAARRPAQQGANGREAAGTAERDGRAGAPSFTNRSTSGMPGIVGAQALDETQLPEHEAISRIASRLNIRL